MALAARRWPHRRFPPLPYTLTIAARLLTPALLAPLTRPIPPSRPPHRPTSRRLAAGLAAIACRRMKGREPPPTPLQQADPRTALSGGLPPRPIGIMLNQDQGSPVSQRSSPGAELSTPRRDASSSLPPVGYLRSSLITSQPPFHSSRRPPSTWPPPAAIHPRSPWPPGPAKLAPS